MNPGVALIIGAVLALGGTIALWILAIPKKKDGTLPPFLQFLHDYFQFKQLYIEIAMKVLFTFLTLLCIGGGFFMLFSKIGNSYYSRSFALYGLILMIGGPIALRIVYEMSMMFILLVQNVSDIKKKLGGAPVPESNGNQPVPRPAPRPAPRPTPYPNPSAGKVCPRCGNKCGDDADFCPECGARL